VTILSGWPIDSKFPADVYERLLDAQESADLELVSRASRELEGFVKKAARDIADKYIDPPATTDYGNSVPAHRRPVRGSICAFQDSCPDFILNTGYP
jgi:hypothetical protein